MVCVYINNDYSRNVCACAHYHHIYFPFHGYFVPFAPFTFYCFRWLGSGKESDWLGPRNDYLLLLIYWHWLGKCALKISFIYFVRSVLLFIKVCVKFTRGFFCCRFEWYTCINAQCVCMRSKETILLFRSEGFSLFSRWFLPSHVVSIHIYESFIGLCFFFTKIKRDLWPPKMKSGKSTHTHITHRHFIFAEALLL